MSPRRVGAIARRATGKILVKRILGAGLTIPDITSVDWDTPLITDLLVCQETINEETESDGTNTADAPVYSKIVSLRLKALVHASTASVIRWMLYKKPDGESLVTNLATQFHTSDDTPTAREVRAMTLAKGIIFMGASNQGTSFNTFVKRKTLSRLGSLSEGDKISLVVAKDAAGTTIPMELMGNIYVRANG